LITGAIHNSSEYSYIRRTILGYSGPNIGCTTQRCFGGSQSMNEESLLSGTIHVSRSM